MRRLTPEQDRQIAKLYKEKTPPPEICEKVGVTIGQFYRSLERTRTPHHYVVERFKVVTMYRNDKLDPEEIAQITRRTVKEVRRILFGEGFVEVGREEGRGSRTNKQVNDFPENWSALRIARKLGVNRSTVYLHRRKPTNFRLMTGED